jgi:hypothetical protein
LAGVDPETQRMIIAEGTLRKLRPGQVLTGATAHAQAWVQGSCAVCAAQIVYGVDDTDQACTAVISKDGVELGRTTFTIADAKKAGLIRPRSPWETHPARMLWARASKYVITDYAPHVALGLALDDEIIEYTGKPADNGVTVHTTFVAPADVIAKNEQLVEEELQQHADLVDEDDA